jgi:hypothetical protein
VRPELRSQKWGPIVALHAEGFYNQAISDRLGVSPANVHRVLKILGLVRNPTPSSVWATGRTPKPVADRFWPKVNKNGPVPEYRPDLGPCWLWTGAGGAGRKGYQKYGHMSFEKRNGKWRHEYAHRVSYLLAHGRLPENDIDHLCRNTMCVNPSHIEDVTTRENIFRAPIHVVHGNT